MRARVDNSMTVREAAQILGVTEKQVQHLGRLGEVTYLARGLLDAGSVRTYQAVRQGRHTRGWAESTAWAAIALLSGIDATWLGQAQLSRLRSRLLGMDASALVAATRNRALVGRFAGHAAAVARLSQDPRTVARRPLAGLVTLESQTPRDWYVEHRHEGDLARAYGLRADPIGEFVLRAVELDSHFGSGQVLEFIEAVVSAGDVLSALDSAASEDLRERALALSHVEDVLERFRSNGR